MSDETEGPELDAVRRLLADARADAPMPDDVSARMDAVLAGLSRERATEQPVLADVVPLDARRRRRAAGLLVAAAAIVVGGVTVAQQLPHHAASQPSAGVGIDRAANGSSSPQATDSTPPVAPQTENGGRKVPLLDGRVRVRSGHFSRDALAARSVAEPTPGTYQGLSLKGLEPDCLPADTHGDVVPATYEKAPAALVFRAPAGSTQIVDLYVCGTAEPVRTVTLPTP